MQLQRDLIYDTLHYYGGKMQKQIRDNDEKTQRLVGFEPMTSLLVG